MQYSQLNVNCVQKIIKHYFLQIPRTSSVILQLWLLVPLFCAFGQLNFAIQVLLSVIPS